MHFLLSVLLFASPSEHQRRQRFIVVSERDISSLLSARSFTRARLPTPTFFLLPLSRCRNLDSPRAVHVSAVPRLYLRLAVAVAP